MNLPSPSPETPATPGGLRRRWQRASTPVRGSVLVGGLALLGLIPWRGETEVLGVFRPLKGSVSTVRAPLAGTLRMGVRKGQCVGYGEILFTITPPPAVDGAYDRAVQAQGMALRNEQAEVERDLEQVRHQLGQLQYRGEPSSRTGLEVEALRQQERDLNQRLRALEQREASLRQAVEGSQEELEPAERTITAPQAGQVYDVAVGTQAMVEAGAVCLTLVPNQAVLQLSALVPEPLARHLKRGTPVRVKAPDGRNQIGPWFDGLVASDATPAMPLSEARSWLPALPDGSRAYRRFLVEKRDVGCIWLPFNQPIRIRMPRPWRPWIVHALS